MDLLLIAIALLAIYVVALVGYRVGRDSAMRSCSAQVAEYRAAARHLTRERNRLAQELADLRAYLKDNR